MKVTDFLQSNIVLLDGAMGTMLQSAGAAVGELPEEINLTSPSQVIAVHKAYFDAGSNIVCTNTFGANLLKFSADKLDQIIKAAIGNAKQAALQSCGSQNKYIALDIGPTGKLLKPLGDLDFERAVELFRTSAMLGEKYGADLILIETMSDAYETKAALLAAKESTSLPVFVSNAFGADGRLLTGASPEVLIPMLEGLQADAIGVNCSLGPDALLPVVRKYLSNAHIPVFFKPNAGLPELINEKTTYNVTPASFADSVAGAVKAGVRAVGGCCGTTPDYIRALAASIAGLHPVPIASAPRTVVTSYAAAVQFGEAPVLIGERINPTGKKRLKQALLESDLGYILNEAVRQQEQGAQILDVNVGLPEIDEPALLEKTVTELQTVTELPLQIDTSSPAAMERALRHYNGKAMINSLNGKKEVMEAIFPLVKKYGGVVVALTLDENGIPDDAEGRFLIAQRILETARSYGINSSDIVFDPLCMAVSAMPQAAAVTLEAVRLIHSRLHCHTVLGVSNVSFGLPERTYLNATFLTCAFAVGLSAAIVNPFSTEIKKAYCSYCALMGADPGFASYIRFAASVPSAAQFTTTSSPADSLQNTPENDGDDLRNAIVNGVKQTAAALAKTKLRSCPALAIITDDIIPALDAVGLKFEQGSLYLPQLLMSAEAAAAAFDEIKAYAASDVGDHKTQTEIVLLTVKGDIHDIGKNIVKLLLQNFGFQVTDLGKDVSPQAALEAVIKSHAPLVGMSALMTTTLPAMQETISLLHEKAPWCKIIVGGAVLTEEYAKSIGADKYAKDAMETVRYAQQTEIRDE